MDIDCHDQTMDSIGDGPAPMQLQRFCVIVGIEDSKNHDLK